MEQHIVNSYDNELNRLRNSVVNMAKLVKELIQIGNIAIVDPSKSLVQLADSTDLKINHFDHEVERLAIHIIALRQPMAIDLRQVIASLKLAVILERMGDLAKKISHRIEYIPIKLDTIFMSLIHEMIVKLDSLLDNAISAYENLDDDLATEVSTQDEIIDEYYRNIMDILGKELENKPKDAKHLLNIVLIVRNLERIGDYITKISYITHYIITGDKRIEH